MLYLNGTPVTPTIFPDKTSQVWKLPAEILLSRNPVTVQWTFDNEGEFLQLAQLKDLLDSQEIASHLVLTYLPYGRQDKEVSNTSTFALRSFAKLLNRLDFFDVTIHDPHSHIALDLIKHSIAVYPVDKVDEIFNDLDVDLICYPDKGALLKYTKVYEDALGDNAYPYIWGDKVRDQSTGNILSYKVLGDPAGKNVLIVDDICDGGMTFKLLARDLLAAGAKEVNLFVTHGIFSKGLRTLHESGIKRIFTEDGEAGKSS